MMVEQRLAVLEKQFDVHGNVGYTILPADLAWLLSLVRSMQAVVEAAEVAILEKNVKALAVMGGDGYPDEAYVNLKDVLALSKALQAYRRESEK